MTYRVLAPLVLARDKAGVTHHVYENGLIDWLDDAQKAHFLEVGLVEKVGGSAAPAVNEVDDAPESDGKPDADANKPELVQWAYDNLAKPDGSDYTKAELNKKSPEDLRELIDSAE